MRILSIETSCDETAVALIDAGGTHAGSITYTLLGNALYSQAKKHAAFGGVYPTLAKREHTANLLPLLFDTLTQADALTPGTPFSETQQKFLNTLFVHEEALSRAFAHHQDKLGAPQGIDAIAVTHGPGLEPALWVGINFAKALSYLWDLPIIPVNHLEGHLVASAVLARAPHVYALDTVDFPTLGLILSGGHTDIVYAHAWGKYKTIGTTRDDSIGEAYDKVARLLDIPYPGGAEVARLAQKVRRAHAVNAYPRIEPFPSPMLHSDNLDVSFSGLKTAVLYRIQRMEPLDGAHRAAIAHAFEEAVVRVLVEKTQRALQQYPTRTCMVGGGVSANQHIRSALRAVCETSTNTTCTLRVPADDLSTDNAVMIGMSAYIAHLRHDRTYAGNDDALTAKGTLPLDTISR